jgi:hypothetical protein
MKVSRLSARRTKSQFSCDVNNVLLFDNDFVFRYIVYMKLHHVFSTRKPAVKRKRRSLIMRRKNGRVCRVHRQRRRQKQRRLR